MSEEMSGRGVDSYSGWRYKASSEATSRRFFS